MHGLPHPAECVPPATSAEGVGLPLQCQSPPYGLGARYASATGFPAGAIPSTPSSASTASRGGVTPDFMWLASYLRAGGEGGLTMAHDVDKAGRVAGTAQKARR